VKESKLETILEPDLEGEVMAGMGNYIRLTQNAYKDAAPLHITNKTKSEISRENYGRLVHKNMTKNPKQMEDTLFNVFDNIVFNYWTQVYANVG